jgi:hypothetical protein
VQRARRAAPRAEGLAPRPVSTRHPPVAGAGAGRKHEGRAGCLPSTCPRNASAGAARWRRLTRVNKLQICVPNPARPADLEVWGGARQPPCRGPRLVPAAPHARDAPAAPAGRQRAAGGLGGGGVRGGAAGPAGVEPLGAQVDQAPAGAVGRKQARRVLYAARRDAASAAPATRRAAAATQTRPRRAAPPPNRRPDAPAGSGRSREGAPSVVRMRALTTRVCGRRSVGVKRCRPASQLAPPPDPSTCAR